MKIWDSEAPEKIKLLDELNRTKVPVMWLNDYLNNVKRIYTTIFDNVPKHIETFDYLIGFGDPRPFASNRQIVNRELFKIGRRLTVIYEFIPTHFYVNNVEQVHHFGWLTISEYQICENKMLVAVCTPTKGHISKIN